jgi:hypothetical protein
MAKEEIDYSREIEKLKEDNPHKSTNEYIVKLLKQNSKESFDKGYQSGFWNGFWISLIALFILWALLMLN